MSIELHCHTLFSVDARGTPEEVVDTAVKNGVKAMAVTDHNHLGAQPRAQQQAQAHGIRYLTGIEFDAGRGGRNYHFLGLGFDPEDPAVQDLADRHTALYGHRFDLLLNEMIDSGFPVSRSKLSAALPRRYPTHPSPVLNQWFARDYLFETGALPDRLAFDNVMQKLRRQIIAKRGADILGAFSSFAEVRDAVQGAGGILVLAHVSRYSPGNAAAQIELIRDFIDAGLDGFELYHHSNLAEPHFGELAKEAERIGCVITGGSDCHNTAGDRRPPLGSSRAPEAILEKIDDLLARRQTTQVTG